MFLAYDDINVWLLMLRCNICKQCSHRGVHTCHHKMELASKETGQSKIVNFNFVVNELTKSMFLHVAVICFVKFDMEVY